MREILAVDVRDRLRATTVPMMYLASTRDWVVPPRCGRADLACRPDATLVRIAGPHLALATNPGAAATEVEAFVRRIPCA